MSNFPVAPNYGSRHPLYIDENDGKIWIATGGENGTDTYQATMGYINIT